MANATSVIPTAPFRPKRVLTVTPPCKAIPIQKKKPIAKASPNADARTLASPMPASPPPTSPPPSVAIGFADALRNYGNKLPASANGTVLSSASSVDNENCVCDRPMAMVICKRCGNELYGRVQLACGAHPKRICLMDQRECVNSFCRSVHLSEVPSANAQRKV